jgi:hypothetical protein
MRLPTEPCEFIKWFVSVFAASLEMAKNASNAAV